MLLLPLILVVLVCPMKADVLNIIRNLKVKLEKSEFSPKGQPFPNIKGPESFDTKIGIIGGGPAGIHMALKLKQKGYQNVTIVEKSPRIGGKAETFYYRQSEIPLAIALWSANYKDTLVPLLEQYGLLKHNGDDFCPNAQLFTWPANNDSIPAFNTFKDQANNVENVLNALTRYTDLHQDLFGTYDHKYGLMERPDERTLAEIGKASFYHFLQDNDLLDLQFVSQMFLTLTGYGTLKEIPAIYGLIWLTPNNLFDIVTNGGGVRTLKFKSIAEIFPKIVEQENLHVMYNFHVIDLKKGQKHNYRVQSWEGQSLEFDFLIWASGNPADYLKVTRKSDLPKLKIQHLLESYKTTYAASSIVDIYNISKASPFQLYWENFNMDYNLSNKVMLDTDFYALGLTLSREAYLKGQFCYKDQVPALHKSTYLTLQYSSINQPQASLKDIRDTLVQHYQGFGAQNIDILYTRMFQWFPRWSAKQTSLGYHWDMYEEQGQANLWFIGGGLSFESLHNIIGYNNLLIDHMTDQ